MVGPRFAANLELHILSDQLVHSDDTRRGARRVPSVHRLERNENRDGAVRDGAAERCGAAATGTRVRLPRAASDFDAAVPVSPATTCLDIILLPKLHFLAEGVLITGSRRPCTNIKTGVSEGRSNYWGRDVCIQHGA